MISVFCILLKQTTFPVKVIMNAVWVFVLILYDAYILHMYCWV